MTTATGIPTADVARDDAFRYDGETRLEQSMAGLPTVYGYDGSGRRLGGDAGSTGTTSYGAGTVGTVARRYVYDAGEDLGAESVGDGAAPSICSKDDVTGNSWRSTRVVTGVFGTYTGHGFTYLDYADQRFYASSYGRFNTDDPYRASAGGSDPSSWNRYSYVGGDPVNFTDRSGLNRDAIDVVS